MALRNISNIPQHYDYITVNYHQPVFIQPSTSLLVPQVATKKQLKNNDNLKLDSKAASTTTSSSGSSSSASSVQIRTSSPISSSESELSGRANSVISPSKFMHAIHQSRKSLNQNQIYQHYQHAVPAQPLLKNYSSMKQLAYEKLRKQQAIDADLREHFKLDAQSNTQAANSQKLKSMGKLKISIYNNLTHLTVHVIEGRSFKLVESNEQIYVKISILPDQEKSFTNIKTKSIKPHMSNTNKPRYAFDSKFSFEMYQLNNFNNRLLLSVWSSKLEKLIGCFSFKLKHLLQKQQQENANIFNFSAKPKQSWYHLLPIKYGISKHLKCSVRKGKKSAKNASDNEQLTNVNKDLIGMQKLQLCLEKSLIDSYGFTITSSCPCMIGKVELDKPAFKFGLRPGDFISKVNGTNVSRATVESVVKMVKASKQKLHIEVYRQDNNLIQDLYQTKPVSHQPQKQTLTKCVAMRAVNQKPFIGLEAVPEEDEYFEEAEFDEVDEDDDESLNNSSFECDYEEEFELEDEIEHRMKNLDLKEDACQYFKIDEEDIRFVDASTCSEINQEPERQVESEAAGEKTVDQADELRRVASQYYNFSFNTNQLNRNSNCKQANIRYLNRSSKNANSYNNSGKNHEILTNNQIQISSFNQFI